MVSRLVEDASGRRDARLQALEVFFAAYEQEHGAFSAEEMRRAEREMRARATVVHGPPRRRSRAQLD